MKLYNKKILFLSLLCVFLCALIVMPYFKEGFFPSHDGEWAVVRAGEMFREIRDHQFPPRYSGALNFGYGYPLFNFAYPFPYYLTVVLHVAKIGLVDSVKAIFALSVFASFLGMFALSSRFFKNIYAGFLSAALYVLLPYHMVDLYVRGSIGESMAFALYPIILLLCIYILDRVRIRLSIFLLSFLVFVLITTHNISAIFFGLILLFYFIALFVSGERKAMFLTFCSFVWGGLISAYFVIPALIEKKYIKLSTIPIADRNLYYVSLSKLIYSPWGYGTPTEKSPFTYQLGITQIIGFLIAIFLSFKNKKRDVYRNISISFIVLSVIMISMMLPLFSFIWKLPLLSEINYPWILLMPLGFLMSLLSGSVIKIKWGNYISIILIIISVILYLGFAKPASYNNNSDVSYLTNLATTTSSNELMPLWVKSEPTTLFIKKIVGQNITNIFYSSNKISFDYASPTSQRIIINQIYYPGWKATIGGKTLDISHDNKEGLMMVRVPGGANKVLLRFTETPLRMFTDLISTFSLLALIIFGISTFVRQRYDKKNRKKISN